MKYQAHPPPVDAFLIQEVCRSSAPHACWCLVEAGELRFADPEMTAPHQPVAGDFWVVENGRASIWERKAFLAKYQPLVA